jgi:hypothetical protein
METVYSSLDGEHRETKMHVKWLLAFAAFCILASSFVAAELREQKFERLSYAMEWAPVSIALVIGFDYKEIIVPLVGSLNNLSRVAAFIITASSAYFFLATVGEFLAGVLLRKKAA